jgi:hypothetical protein
LHQSIRCVRLWRKCPVPPTLALVDQCTQPTRSEHRHEVPLPLAARDVARILDARPASWVSSFLRIAALWAGSLRQAASPPWFRLGSSQPSEDGALTASFAWRPHLDGGLFSSFRGQFAIRPADQGCTFVLEGTASGGTAATNDRVLAALLESLSSALSAGQEPAG